MWKNLLGKKNKQENILKNIMKKIKLHDEKKKKIYKKISKTIALDFSKSLELITVKKPSEFNGPQSNQLIGSTFEFKNNVLNKKFFENSIFIQGIPLTISRTKLLDIFKEFNGFESLILSDPVKGERRIQYGWVRFTTQKILEKVLLEESQGGLNGKKVSGTFYLNLFPKTSPSNNRRKHVLKNIFSSPKRLKHDLKQAFKLIIHLDKVNKVYSHKLFESSQFSSLKLDLQRMNLATEYLRRTHLLCYYQAHYFLTKEHLINKFPYTYLRKKFEPSRRMIFQDEPFACERLVDNWWKKMMKEVGYIEKLWERKKKKELCEENTTEIKKGKKYRCALCRKAFKGKKFVEKHIINKHTPIVDLYLRKEIEKETLMNYSKDPNKLFMNHFEKKEIKIQNRLNSMKHNLRNPNKRAIKKLTKNVLRDQDAPLPERFEHTEIKEQRKNAISEENIRTVRDYSTCKEIIALDDLLDYGFGDFKTGPKFNL